MRNKGWYREPIRHGLASNGIKTTVKGIKENFTEEEIGKILKPLTMSENPYIEFKDKYNNPVDNVICKRTEHYEYCEGDEPEEHLFHTTSYENIDDIAKEGLRTDVDKKWEDSFDAIFFSDFPAYSIMWEVRHLMFGNDDCIYEREGNCKFGLLRVPEDEIEYKWDERGTTSQYGTSFYTKDNIPPEKVEIRTPAGWVNLKTYKQLKEEYT